MENNAIRHPEEFDCTRDRTITQRWDNYVTKLKRYFIMTGMNDPAAKQACLLYYGGDALSNIFETLENQLALVNEDDEVIDIFTATTMFLINTLPQENHLPTNGVTSGQQAN